MKRRYLAVLLSACGFWAAQTAMAQSVFNPAFASGARGKSFGLVFSNPEIDYKIGSTNAEVERTILAAEFGFGLQPTIDIFGEFGLIMKSEMERVDQNGKGFMFGVGGRGIVFQQKYLHVFAHGTLHIVKEEYSNVNAGAGGNRDLDFDLTEFQFGATGKYLATNEVSFFAGLDFIPYSDGNAKWGDTKSSAERDDSFALRFGGGYKLSSGELRAQISLVGEQGFLLGGNFRI